jgi:hypothetical protein
MSVEKTKRMMSTGGADPKTQKNSNNIMTLSDSTRLIFTGFFASHIPISLLLDGQVVFPAQWFPEVIQNVREFYVATFRDPLMTGPPFDPWFQSLVVCELLLQVPYFFLAVHMLTKTETTTKNQIRLPSWFRSLSIVYGAHTATTLVPILATILLHDDISTFEKMTLFGFYAPYFLLPASWAYIMMLSQEEEKSKSE